MRPTLYEFAGGRPALMALATAHHRRCLEDPELSHPFSHVDRHAEHVERLAAYWGEVMGGQPTYSTTCADHASVLRMHSGNGDLGASANASIAASYKLWTTRTCPTTRPSAPA